jgi:hypothetical protein
MKNVRKFIKKFDMFGHPILIHVDKHGEYHKTIHGGFLSIIYLVFIIGYIGFCIWKMIEHK